MKLGTTAIAPGYGVVGSFANFLLEYIIKTPQISIFTDWQDYMSGNRSKEEFLVAIEKSLKGSLRGLWTIPNLEKCFSQDFAIKSECKDTNMDMIKDNIRASNTTIAEWLEKVLKNGEAIFKKEEAKELFFGFYDGFLDGVLKTMVLPSGSSLKESLLDEAKNLDFGDDKQKSNFTKLLTDKFIFLHSLQKKSNKLKEATFKVADHSYCSRVLGEKFVCITSDGVEGSSCQGDSGGPVVTKKSDGSYQIIGITSMLTGSLPLPCQCSCRYFNLVDVEVLPRYLIICAFFLYKDLRTSPPHVPC